MSGTDFQHAAAGPAIILVEPQLGENIGMVARAMANFGLSELRLVNPRDGWPSEKARAAASRADHVIDAVTVFDDLASAVADLNFVFATTARQRDGFKSVRGPVEAGRALRARHIIGQRTGILFGRERFGLYNDEVGLADEIVTFPVDPGFSSLNIAQAVLLMSYEWMKSGLEDETDDQFLQPGDEAGEQGRIARPVCLSGRRARSARLFPPGAEEAEDGRQSARRADARRFCRAGAQGAARHHLVTRPVFAGNAARRRLARRRSKTASGSRAKTPGRQKD